MDLKTLTDEQLLTVYLNVMADGNKKAINKIEKEINKRNNKE